MALLYSIQRFSRQRKSWLLLLLFVLFFESCALFFQHVLKLPPCVMCIYERISMLGIGAAAIIGALKPQHLVVRWLGLLGWVASTWKGLSLALEHVTFQFDPSPFHMCDLFVHFPSWLPLNKWMPWIFEAYGECSQIVWQFLSLSMPQWLVIIFVGNLIAGLVVIMSQFTKKA